MHLAPACTFWLAVGMFAVEWPAMQENQALLLIARKPYLYLSGARLASWRMAVPSREEHALFGSLVSSCYCCCC